MAHAGATGWGWEALRLTASSASGQEAVDCVEFKPVVGQVTGLSKSVPTAGIFFWGVTEWQKERGYRRSRSE